MRNTIRWVNDRLFHLNVKLTINLTIASREVPTGTGTSKVPQTRHFSSIFDQNSTELRLEKILPLELNV
jgi:hypothetical protein